MQRKEIKLIGGLLVAAALAVATVSATAAQSQPAPGPGGMMGGNGPRQGTGMMDGYGQGAQPSTSLDSLDAAKQAFAGYLDRTGNQDLVLDEVLQFQWNYYAIVKETSSGAGATVKLLAERARGLLIAAHWIHHSTPLRACAGVAGRARPGTATPQVRELRRLAAYA